MMPRAGWISLLLVLLAAAAFAPVPPAAAASGTVALRTTIAAGAVSGPASLDEDVRVAQLFGAPPTQNPNQPQRKRRTLMDMLFGGDQPQAPAQQPRPRTAVPKAAPTEANLPAAPKTPLLEKAPTATRLAIIGDSLAVDLANAFERLYADDPNLVVVPMGVGSSSFVRPDYFDWNARLAEAIANNSFDIAVVTLGINDRQTISTGGQSYRALTEEWQSIYRQRVSEFVGQFRSAGKPLIWVGLPPMQASSYGEAIGQISALQRLAVFAGGGEFVDIYDRFVDENGKYSSFGPDLKGQRARMRKDDGIHFATAGADKLAFYVNQSVKLFYRGGGSIGLDVADPLLGTDAQLMVRPPYQGLGDARLLEIAGPVIPLTTSPRRAAELVSAGGTEAIPRGFDYTLLVTAPAGRVDAFGIGVAPTSNAGGR